MHDLIHEGYGSDFGIIAPAYSRRYSDFAGFRSRIARLNRESSAESGAQIRNLRRLNRDAPVWAMPYVPQSDGSRVTIDGRRYMPRGTSA
jgi:hypothetical protein